MIVGEISSVKSFEELYNLMREKKQIRGTKIIYPFGDLIDLIEDIRMALEGQRIRIVTRPEIQAFIKKIILCLRKLLEPRD